ASLRGKDEVAVTFFGDAAFEQGVTHESLAFATLRRLPVLFVCENNFYATLTPLTTRQSGEIWRRAAAHGLSAACVDGNDVTAVPGTARAAVERASRGDGPSFIEATTYRWREHVGPNFDTELGSRTQAELDAWIARDPIDTLARRLEADGVLDRAMRAELDAE